MRSSDSYRVFLVALISTWAPGFGNADTIEPAAANKTECLVAPYGWLPAVTLGQSSDGSGGGVSGSDLLKKTDATGMIRIEAARNRWGISLDYIFLSLSGERTVPLTRPISPAASVRGDLDLEVVELSGIYRPSGDAEGVSVLFGLRNIQADKTLLVTPLPAAPPVRFVGDVDLTDVMLGARYLHRLNDRWELAVRGDYSFGDSEGTLNAIASSGFRFNQAFALQLGYRYVDLEYEDSTSGTTETTDIDLSGAFLGLVFRF